MEQPSFRYENGTAYFRDAFVPFQNAQVSIASSPVLYGLAIYTVFNVLWDESEKRLKIFRLHDHWARLSNSAKIMGFEDFTVRYPYETFEQLMADLLQKNAIQENVLVRASIFIDELIAGTRIEGLKNAFAAYVYPMAQFYPKEGIHACVSTWRRVADEAIPARAKVNGSYANASLMKNEALRNGFDEAIALDGQGHVTEGPVANIFLVRNSELVTPEASTDILEGITRDTVIKLAQHAGISYTTRPVDKSELYIADEIFFCGSSARITPILSVDKRLVGSGAVGSITSKIASLYEDAQYGRIEAFKHYIISVE